MKIGKFYNVYGEAAYILYYLLSYKISSGLKTGFPEQAKDKVVNVLEDNKISYKIYEKDELIEEKDFKKLNKYSKFVSKGILKYKNKDKLASLNEKINNLNELELNELLDIIEKYLSQK